MNGIWKWNQWCSIHPIWVYPRHNSDPVNIYQKRSTNINIKNERLQAFTSRLKFVFIVQACKHLDSVAKWIMYWVSEAKGTGFESGANINYRCRYIQLTIPNYDETGVLDFTTSHYPNLLGTKIYAIILNLTDSQNRFVIEKVRTVNRWLSILKILIDCSGDKEHLNE